MGWLRAEIRYASYFRPFAPRLLGLEVLWSYFGVVMSDPARVIDDRFELQRKLGTGGFGDVWLALDRLGNNKPIALKLLHPHLIVEDGIRRRFTQEAELLTKLDHPSIAGAFAWSVDGEVPYLAMEFVDGRPLDEEIRDLLKASRHFDLKEVERIMGELGAAIDYAHSMRVVHRDLKPKNIMIVRRTGSLYVKVLDFGVAKVLDAEQGQETTAGRAIGSLLYMSAEQVKGLTVDHRSDVFALGVILFELLTLMHPWIRKNGQPAPCAAVAGSRTKENNIVTITMRIAMDPRPSLAQIRPELPPALTPVLEQALSIEPDDRFDSAKALIDAFVAALRAPPQDVLVDSGPRIDHSGEVFLLDSSPQPTSLFITSTKLIDSDSSPTALLVSTASSTGLDSRAPESRRQPIVIALLGLIVVGVVGFLVLKVVSPEDPIKLWVGQEPAISTTESPAKTELALKTEPVLKTEPKTEPELTTEPEPKPEPGEDVKPDPPPATTPEPPEPKSIRKRTPPPRPARKTVSAKLKKAMRAASAERDNPQALAALSRALLEEAKRLRLGSRARTRVERLANVGLADFQILKDAYDTLEKVLGRSQ